MSRKVCFYINSLVKNGAQRVIVNLAHTMRQDGYEVTVVTTKIEKEQGEYELAGSINRVVSDLTAEQITDSRIRNFLARVRKLRSIWKAERPDLIVSFIGKNNMMAILSSFFLKIPVVISVRTVPKREYYTKALKLVSKTLFVFAKGIVLQTRDAMDYFPAFIRRKAVILPNPLNPAFIRPRFEGTRQDEIVAVGRLDDNKNQQMLIRAFCGLGKEFVEQQCPGLKLIIYGTGENESRLRELVGQSGWQERILMPGEVDRVEETIYRSRIYVLTSKMEGMPNALMEAMALGLAVVSTDCPCGGPRTLIRNGENGILVPVDDDAALTEALKKILTDPGLEKRLGENAAGLGRELSPERVSRQWLDYLERCMRNKKA